MTTAERWWGTPCAAGFPTAVPKARTHTIEVIPHADQKAAHGSRHTPLDGNHPDTSDRRRSKPHRRPACAHPAARGPRGRSDRIAALPSRHCVRGLLVPDSPLVIANPDLAPAVLGALMGGPLDLLVLLPSGRHSGGHLNPADTVDLWRLKVFPGQAVIPYITAPAAGSLAGTALGGLAWGTTARHAPASVRPAPTWNATAVSTAEAGSVVAVTTVLGAFLNRPYTRLRLPYAVGLATALIIAPLGPCSGGSANPARQLGPALLSGNTTHLWIYLLAPVIGVFMRRRHLAHGRRAHPPGAYPPCPSLRSRHTPQLPSPSPGLRRMVLR